MNSKKAVKIEKNTQIFSPLCPFPPPAPVGERENVPYCWVFLWIATVPEEWGIMRGAGEMSRESRMTQVLQAQAAGVSEDARLTQCKGAGKEWNQQMKSDGDPGRTLFSMSQLFPCCTPASAF